MQVSKEQTMTAIKQDNTILADYPIGTHIAVILSGEDSNTYFYKRALHVKTLYVSSCNNRLWADSGFTLSTLLKHTKKVVWVTESLTPLVEAWYQAQTKDSLVDKPSLPEPIKLDAPMLCKRAYDLLSERGKQYDGLNQERSMASTVAAFNAIYGTTMTELQGWHFMCLLKMVRQRAGGHVDSAEDLIAYAALAAETVHN